MGLILLFILRLARLAGKTVGIIASGLGWNHFDEKLENFFGMLMKYRHPGYLSYLMGSGNDAYLRRNLSVFDKISFWLKSRRNNLKPFRKLVSDHMIEVYVEKLKEPARKRI